MYLQIVLNILTVKKPSFQQPSLWMIFPPVQRFPHCKYLFCSCCWIIIVWFPRFKHSECWLCGTIIVILHIQAKSCPSPSSEQIKVCSNPLQEMKKISFITKWEFCLLLLSWCQGEREFRGVWSSVLLMFCCLLETKPCEDPCGLQPKPTCLKGTSKAMNFLCFIPQNSTRMLK